MIRSFVDCQHSNGSTCNMELNRERRQILGTCKLERANKHYVTCTKTKMRLTRTSLHVQSFVCLLSGIKGTHALHTNITYIKRKDSGGSLF